LLLDGKSHPDALLVLSMVQLGPELNLKQFCMQWAVARARRGSGVTSFPASLPVSERTWLSEANMALTVRNTVV